MRKTTFILPAIVILVALFMSSLFIVDERQKALVLQFGRVVSVKEDPGLAFKIPLIQEVARYDDRILSIDVDPLEITPLDDRRLVVDAFARYRIADVNRFREATGASGDTALRMAAARLDSILRAQTREVLGSVTSDEILSSDRFALMLRIRNGAIGQAEDLGLEVIDVRLKRTDLPTQNLEATFERMRAEREREATDERARGNEAAQRIRAQADRTVVELTSEAQREAEIVRGEADAQRNGIFAEAFGQDEEFFEFYRSLTAYTRALRGENSSMVISPDGEFFDYLRSPTGGREITPSAPRPEEEVQAEEDAALESAQEALEETEAESQTEEEAETSVDNFEETQAEDAEEGVND
ncbi:protease modulator HflC [Marinibacterium profundimaris]|uniref:protease modulator HflC n=1 Tax=Marinibacterium profundimaris TaxID=1679460 RepID=UPI000B5208EB|nr:protease modulator HflC [Marinibacterium profundimaris]